MVGLPRRRCDCYAIVTLSVAKNGFRPRMTFVMVNSEIYGGQTPPRSGPRRWLLPDVDDTGGVYGHGPLQVDAVDGGRREGAVRIGTVVEPSPFLLQRHPLVRRVGAASGAGSFAAGLAATESPLIVFL
jgi:hypothetical protein